MNKKDLIIAVLATFCLTSTLFTILPSKSGIPYDPWADVSGPSPGTENGTINMRDIAYLIQMFGQSGNTTKDVNVMNWPSDPIEPPWKPVVIVENSNLTWETNQYGSVTTDPIYPDPSARQMIRWVSRRHG